MHALTTDAVPGIAITGKCVMLTVLVNIILYSHHVVSDCMTSCLITISIVDCNLCFGV